MRVPNTFGSGSCTLHNRSSALQRHAAVQLQAPILQQQHSRLTRVNGAQHFPNHSAASTRATATGNVGSSTAAEEDTSGQITISVEGVIVNPAYRSTPWEAEARREKAAEDKAVVMFVSESGICRGPLAAAAFSHLLQHSPLKEILRVDMRATRDYCKGQTPDPTAAAAAETLGFSLFGLTPDSQSPAAAAAAAAAAGSNGGSSGGSKGDEGWWGEGGVAVFDPSEDIVTADLALVMDKYTAADVLREVSSYDLINPGGRYSSRVRLLGSFHPQLAAQDTVPDGMDIDDALYGNEGGDNEKDDVLSAAKLIVESCRNLLQYLEDLAANNGLLYAPNSTSGSATAAAAAADAGGSNGSSSSVGAKFKAVLLSTTQQEGVIEWLVPPMLQGGNVDVDGWV